MQSRISPDIVELAFVPASFSFALLVVGKYCVQFHNISVDRINSNKSYSLKNIHLVCNIINVIKWDLNFDDFLDICKLVSKKSSKTEKLN